VNDIGSFGILEPEINSDDASRLELGSEMLSSRVGGSSSSLVDRVDSRLAPSIEVASNTLLENEFGSQTLLGPKVGSRLPVKSPLLTGPLSQTLPSISPLTKFFHVTCSSPRVIAIVQYTPIELILDTGAEVSILSRQTYNKVLSEHKVPKTQNSENKISPKELRNNSDNHSELQLGNKFRN